MKNTLFEKFLIYVAILAFFFALGVLVSYAAKNLSFEKDTEYFDPVVLTYHDIPDDALSQPLFFLITKHPSGEFSQRLMPFELMPYGKCASGFEKVKEVYMSEGLADKITQDGGSAVATIFVCLPRELNRIAFPEEFEE